MSDIGSDNTIIERLRQEVVWEPEVSRLMQEAAAYIDCLRMALGEISDGKRNPRMAEALKLWESFK